MLVLVTGGAGFIGSHVVRALFEARHGVRVLDARPPEPPQFPPGVAFVRGDVRDRTVVEETLRGVDAVCHQAAMVGLGRDFDDAPAYVECNDLGTAVLLKAMSRLRVSELVLAGSMVYYGEGRYECARHETVRPGPRQVADLDAGRFEPVCPRCGDPLTPGLVPENAPPDPRNVYAATKVAQEHLAAAWARATGGRAVALRYHNVYGPGMPRDTPYAGVASLFRSALARGEPPRVFEDGGQLRDLIHVADVAAANLAALDAVGAAIPAGTLRAYNRRQRQPAHRGRDGHRTLRGLRRARAGGDRRVPAGRRPPHHRLLVTAAQGTRLAAPGTVRRRHAGVREGPTARPGIGASVGRVREMTSSPQPPDT